MEWIIRIRGVFKLQTVGDERRHDCTHTRSALWSVCVWVVRITAPPPACRQRASQRRHRGPEVSVAIRLMWAFLVWCRSRTEMNVCVPRALYEPAPPLVPITLGRLRNTAPPTRADNRRCVCVQTHSAIPKLLRRLVVPHIHNKNPDATHSFLSQVSWAHTNTYTFALRRRHQEVRHISLLRLPICTSFHDSYIVRGERSTSCQSSLAISSHITHPQHTYRVHPLSCPTCRADAPMLVHFGSSYSWAAIISRIPLHRIRTIGRRGWPSSCHHRIHLGFDAATRRSMSARGSCVKPSEALAR